jgi:hypothetical protein
MALWVAEETISRDKFNQKSVFVGTSAPATTFAGQHWFDSANNIRYIRNKDNNAWILKEDQSVDTTASPTFSALYLSLAGGVAIQPYGMNLSNEQIQFGNGVNAYENVIISRSALSTLTLQGDANIYFKTGASGVKVVQIDVNGNIVLGASATVDGRDISADINQAVLTTSNPTFAGILATSEYTATRAAAGNGILSGKVTGDAVTRFYITADGSMAWGAGAGAVDTTFSRVGVGSLGMLATLNVHALAHVEIPAKGTSNASTSMILTNDDTAYGILMGVESSGKGWIQVQRTSGAATAYNLRLEPNGGIVETGSDLTVLGTSIKLANTNMGLYCSGSDVIYIAKLGTNNGISVDATGQLTASNGIVGTGIGVITYVDVAIDYNESLTIGAFTGYRVSTSPWNSNSTLAPMLRVLALNPTGESTNNSIAVGGRFWYHRNGADNKCFVFDTMNSTCRKVK